MDANTLVRANGSAVRIESNTALAPAFDSKGIFVVVTT
eukprot:COSAG01_NODE_5551_length_4188_cov_4.790902_3_plen_38_part_00